jgi:hypothetical protein
VPYQKRIFLPGGPFVSASVALMAVEPEIPELAAAEIPAELHFLLPPLSF